MEFDSSDQGGCKAECYRLLCTELYTTSVSAIYSRVKGYLFHGVNVELCGEAQRQRR